jgi:hypothetical protein
MRVTIQAGPASQVVELPALQPAPMAAPATVRGPTRVEPSSGSAQRTLGWVSAGLGAVALVAGGILGYRAYSLDKSSKTECREDEPNACTARGAELRDQARGAAQLSTISSAAGGMLAVAGVTLVLTAPTRQAEPVASNVSVQLRGVW